MAGADMADDTDQAPVAVDHDAAAPSGAEPSGAEGASLPPSEVVWILGDTVTDHPAADAADMHLPADGHLALDASLSDAPANLDHALHQLTTATDLFDVPVLDFDGHHYS
jgi:hypothetical protein